MADQHNRTRTLIHELQDINWELGAIANALGVNFNTIYRWRDNGTNDQNHGRLEALKLTDAKEHIRMGFIRGVYYIQLAGTNWVKIGHAQNLTKRMATIQTHSPYHLRLVAWHAHQKESEHHKLWGASRGLGEWFAYHPDMEQEAADQIAELKAARAIRGAVQEEALMEDWREHGKPFSL